MLALKTAIAVMVVLMGYVLWCRVRAYARLRYTHPEAINLHRWWARRALWMTIAAIVLIEVAVFMGGDARDYAHWLFIVHLSLAVPFLILLVALQFLTGLVSPIFHKAFGYACLCTFLGAAVTGVILLPQL